MITIGIAPFLFNTSRACRQAGIIRAIPFYFFDDLGQIITPEPPTQPMDPLAIQIPYLSQPQGDTMFPIIPKIV